MGIFPDANDQDAGSSAAPNQDEDLDLTPQGGSEGDAGSSSADGDNEDKSTLSLIRDVVADDKEGDKSTAASPAEGTETGDEAGEEQPKAEGDPEEFSHIPFHEHKDFKRLVRQRNSYREDAVRYQNVQSFIDNAGLTSDEAADILVSASLAKSDPAKCWQQIKPWVQKVLIAAGEVLPDDLSQRVQNGEISQEAALELSRATARAQSVEASRTFEQQRAEKRQAEAHSNSLQSEAQRWEADRQAKDPNFEAKTPLIMERLVILQHHEGRPNTPEGVRAQLQKAYAQANENFRPPAAPVPTPTPSVNARRPIRPVTGGTVSGAPQAKPENTLDIIRAARSQRG